MAKKKQNQEILLDNLSDSPLFGTYEPTREETYVALKHKMERLKQEEDYTPWTPETESTKPEIKMTLEEYKKAVEENLLAVTHSESFTAQIMRDYDEEFPRFLEEGWTVEELTPAIANYFI